MYCAWIALKKIGEFTTKGNFSCSCYSLYIFWCVCGCVSEWAISIQRIKWWEEWQSLILLSHRICVFLLENNTMKKHTYYLYPSRHQWCTPFFLPAKEKKCWGVVATKREKKISSQFSFHFIFSRKKWSRQRRGGRMVWHRMAKT